MRSVLVESVKGRRRACLRDMFGAAEQAVTSVESASAIALVDRLLLARGDADLPPGSASLLSVSDRDAVLAEVYRGAYGNRVESSATCGACGARFDLSFDVEDLLRRARAERRSSSATSEPAIFAEGECRFRLPTGGDELEVGGMAPDDATRELLSRCMVEGDAGRHGDAIQRAMESVAPLLDLELSATCPDCGHAETVRFSLQAYLLTALVQEQPRLLREVHALARAYGWGLAEILALTRAQRRTLVEMIEAEEAGVR